MGARNQTAFSLPLCPVVTLTVNVIHTQCHPTTWHSVVCQEFMCSQGFPGEDSGNWMLCLEAFCLLCQRTRILMNQHIHSNELLNSPCLVAAL